MFMMFGALTLLSVAVVYAYRPLRNVEAELPDVLRDAPSDAVPAGRSTLSRETPA